MEPTIYKVNFMDIFTNSYQKDGKVILGGNIGNKMILETVLYKEDYITIFTRY